MEHLNLVVGDMETAKKFYVEFMGLTVDAGNAKHFNLGQQQVRWHFTIGFSGFTIMHY
jgi:catechol 2,3-dioxygenase-like lactoylglutathione lyase family enzyme